MIDETDAIIVQTTDELELIELEQIETVIAEVEENIIIEEISDHDDYNIINEINANVNNVKLTNSIFSRLGKFCRKRMRKFGRFMICKSRKK